MQDLFFQVKDLIFSKTAKDTYLVFAGNFASFLFGILFAILAVREIDPAGWGIFSAAGGMMVIIFAVAELGLGSGLFKFVSSLWRKGQKQRTEKIVSVIFLTRLATALAFSFLIIVSAQYLSGWILKSESPQLMFFVAAGLIGSLLNDFQISLLQAKGRWGRSSFLLALTNFFRLTTLVVWKRLFGFNLESLFAVFFLSPFISFLISLYWERPRLSFPAGSLKIFKKISKFSLWMGVNRSVGSISSRVDAIVLLQLGSAFEAGIVGAARQLSNAVLVLLASFATVIAPRFASYQGSHLKKYFRKTCLFSLLLAGGVLLGVVVVKPLIGLFGPKYSLSAGVLKWLLLGLVPFALSVPAVNALIYSFHKPQIIAVLSLVQLPLIILGNILLIPKLGIYGPVLVIGLWNLSTLAVSFLAVRKRL